MNEQINIRLPEKMTALAQVYANKHGFSNIQELIRELLRRVLYEELSPEESVLVKKLLSQTEKKGLWASEAELLKKLRQKDGI